MALIMPGASVSVPRSLRMRFWFLRVARWLVPTERCFTLPLAVRRNRFFVPLWVFCLGIAKIQTDQFFVGWNPPIYRFGGRLGREVKSFGTGKKRGVSRSALSC